MARGRVLSASISTSRRLAFLVDDTGGCDAALLFTWMVPHSDVSGRMLAEPELVKADVVPRLRSFTVEAVARHLDAMEELGLIIRYSTADGEALLQIQKAADHQPAPTSGHCAPSKFPPPPEALVLSEEKRVREALAKRSRNPRAGSDLDLDRIGKGLPAPSPKAHNPEPSEPTNPPPAEEQPTTPPESSGAGARASAGGDSGFVPGSTGLASMPPSSNGGGAQLPDPGTEPLTSPAPPLAPPPIPASPPVSGGTPRRTPGGGAGGVVADNEKASPRGAQAGGKPYALEVAHRASKLAAQLEELGAPLPPQDLEGLRRLARRLWDVDLERVAGEAAAHYHLGGDDWGRYTSGLDCFGAFASTAARADATRAENLEHAALEERERVKARRARDAADKAREEAERAALNTPEAQARRAELISARTAELEAKWGGLDVAPRPPPAPNPEWTRNPEAA